MKRISETDLAIKTSKGTPQMQIEMLVGETLSSSIKITKKDGNDYRIVSVSSQRRKTMKMRVVFLLG